MEKACGRGLHVDPHGWQHRGTLMDAKDLPITTLLDGAKQFIVPIFQRDYSWGTKQCLTLWSDIIRVGSDHNIKGHFLGSVVYIAAEENPADLTRWLLIDGQQRLTTLILILLALRVRLKEHGDEPGEDSPTAEALDDYYLRNRHGKGDRRYKLHLRRADQETLAALLDGKAPGDGNSEKIMENFQFLKEKVANADIPTVYNGIKKLIVVHVCLTRGQDDPQMIFESLNSTGLDLTPADLIRNFVLMRLDEQTQTRLFEDYWQPIEIAFGARYRTDFDTFVRDYLTIRLRASTPIRSEAIYQEFCKYFTRATENDTVESVLADLKRFSAYYTALSLGDEKEPDLKTAFDRLHTLIDVATPVILTLYDCYDRTKTLTLQEFIQAVELLESYVFRRSVCDLQTRSLGQIFASLANRIQEQSPLTSLKVALYRQSKKRRFPTDNEFLEALEVRDVYDMRNCFYLLDRLENFSKERIDTSTFTIEHVMPQNEDLRPEWRTMLGPDWKHAHEIWLHRLGNVTLTGYNSTYSDRPFSEKKAIPRGFNESPLRLNKFIREQSTWTITEIQERGTQLASKAITVWPPLTVDIQTVKKAELKERIAQAADYKLDGITIDAVARKLFDALRPQLQALGADVVELCTAASVTYRVYDFFVEVIPRRYRLTLLVNLAFEDCSDPSGKARNATEAAFVINATESGGVLYDIKDAADIPAAINIARQGYVSIAE
jgi:uncharacterized protein with ParB-like and HNH nuclease domain/predicted transport protein